MNIFGVFNIIFNGYLKSINLLYLIQYGTGYARGIVFQDIHLVNIENPIIIDQHYCTNSENSDCPAPVCLLSIKILSSHQIKMQFHI